MEYARLEGGADHCGLQVVFPPIACPKQERLKGQENLGTTQPTGGSLPPEAIQHQLGCAESGESRIAQRSSSRGELAGVLDPRGARQDPPAPEEGFNVSHPDITGTVATEGAARDWLPTSFTVYESMIPP
jgi:hypothetical protein